MIMHKLGEEFNGEFRIARNETDPGYAAIFANFPASNATTGIALSEEVRETCVGRKRRI